MTTSQELVWHAERQAGKSRAPSRINDHDIFVTT